MFTVRKQDEFGRKLKYTIHDVLNRTEDSNHILTSILRKISTDSITYKWRFFWSIILGLSTALCFLLLHERFAYYFSEPTVVNVQNDILHPEDIPIVSLLTTASEKFTQYLKEVNMTKKDSVNLFMDVSCAEPNQYYLSYEQINVNRLWNSLIANDVVERIYLPENSSMSVNMTITYKATVRGVSTHYHIRDLKQMGTVYTKISFKFNMTKFNTTCDHPQLLIGFIMNGKSTGTVAFSSTITSQVSLRWQKDIRLKKKSYHCVDWSVHAECEKKCYQQSVKNYGVPCKFPFVTSNEILPECKGSTNTSTQYIILKAMAAGVLPKGVPRCLCDIPCEKYLVNKNFFLVEKSGNVFSVLLDPIIKKMVEKLAYDKIALVCDLGGNIGLCLGISCLMIMETFIVLISQLVKKPRKKKLPVQLHTRITKCASKMLTKFNYNLEDSFFLPGVQYIISKEKDKPKMAVWSVIIFISAIVCGCQIYDRVSYYLSSPVNISVKLVQLKFIDLPEVVICFETQKLTFAKKKRMKKQLGLSNTMCPMDFDTLELMDEMKLSDIWEKYSLDNQYSDLRNYMKDVNGLDARPLVAEPYSTVFGNCVKFSTPRSKMYPNFVGYLSKLESSSYKNCPHYIKIFQKAPGEDVNFRNYFHMISSQTVVVAYTMQKLIAKNVRQRPCNSKKVGQTCERKCMVKKMKEKLICSLPFMTNSSLLQCEIKSLAIKTRDEYKSVILNVDPIRDCGCLKRCVQDIYYPNVKSVWEYTPVNQLLITIQHNYKEFMEEKFSFSFVKLLCDIGSNLGIVLGMSAMSLMSDISKYFNYRQLKT